MEENYIRILIISELEKNLSYFTIDISKLLTLKSISNSIKKYIKEKSKIKEVTVKIGSIEDHLFDELNGNFYKTKSILSKQDIEEIYLYIFPYILEFLEDYITIFIKNRALRIMN